MDLTRLEELPSKESVRDKKLRWKSKRAWEGSYLGNTKINGVKSWDIAMFCIKECVGLHIDDAYSMYVKKSNHKLHPVFWDVVANRKWDFYYLEKSWFTQETIYIDDNGFIKLKTNPRKLNKSKRTAKKSTKRQRNKYRRKLKKEQSDKIFQEYIRKTEEKKLLEKQINDNKIHSHGFDKNSFINIK